MSLANATLSVDGFRPMTWSDLIAQVERSLDYKVTSMRHHAKFYFWLEQLFMVNLTVKANAMLEQ